MTVSEMVDNNNDNVLPLAILLVKYTPLVVIIMTVTNVLSKNHDKVASSC